MRQLHRPDLSRLKAIAAAGPNDDYGVTTWRSKVLPSSLLVPNTILVAPPGVPEIYATAKLPFPAEAKKPPPAAGGYSVLPESNACGGVQVAPLS